MDKAGRRCRLGDGEPPKLAPLTETGTGAVQDKEKARLAEIIEKVNGLFEGDLTDDDQLVYVFPKASPRARCRAGEIVAARSYFCYDS